MKHRICILPLLLGLAACSQPALQPALPDNSQAAPFARRHSAVTVLYDFPGSKDGSHPWSGLINVGGVLYGTTSQGGHRYGTVIKVDASGVSLVYAFKGESDGAFPAANLNSVHKTLYGVTREGGSEHYSTCGGRGCGTVFAIEPSGYETILHRFTGSPDGSYPNARLTEDNGVFYGTTVDGGLYNDGTVYSITPQGREEVLYSFEGGRDGANPEGRLIHVNGLLYGTTFSGGAYGGGTVFQMKLNGTEKILNNLGAAYGDPINPVAGLTYLHGIFYGTTIGGGVFSYIGGMNGTVFSMTPSGSLQVLHAFTGSDGGDPVAALTAIGGVLYGTTADGPYYGYKPYDGCGFVYKITTDGTFTDLAQLQPGLGCHSVSPLTVVNGYLVGTATGGGPYHHGTIFDLPL